MKAQEIKDHLKKMGFTLMGEFDRECSIKPFRGELFYSPIGKALKKNSICHKISLDLYWCSFEDNSNIEIGLRVKVKVGSDTCKEKNIFTLQELKPFIDRVEDEYLSNRVITIR